MQEQNFEKQVRQKMEELSLTPSEPVWKKVEEQIREKRDRKRLLFWLPLIALLLAGGIWFISSNTNNNYSISKTGKEEDRKTNTSSPTEQKTRVQGLEKPSVTSEKEQSVITNKNLQQENKIPSESAPQALQSQAVNNNQKRIAKTISATQTQPAIEINNNEKKKPTTETNSQEFPVTGKEELSKVSKQDEQAPIDGSANKDSIVSQSKAVPSDTIAADTASIIEPATKTIEEDSVSIKNKIAKTGKNISAKWKLAITGYFGRSGVSNGLDLFGGGAKSLETNAFADQSAYTSISQPNSNPGAAYRPPSAQSKSTSFALGALVKKQIGKRIVFSTGLQYNFYSTQMQVGQSVNRDTMVDRNKTVNSFYANSGSQSSFSEYKNKFHFISLPIGLDFQLLKRLPLDFHLGLSLHRLMKTNALLYSSFSQVYYDDKDAFNKTLLFSEIGFDYSIPINKNFSLKAGPRASYSHTGAIKGSSNQHLFSYGIATQFIFSGK